MGVQEDINSFEKGLNELIVKYEQYFLGIEKREPLKLLEEMEKLSRRYQSSNIINTMLIFKYNTLKARLVSYKQYWNRTNRLIEEGKYFRDRFKMAIHTKAQDQIPSPPEATTGLNPEKEHIYQQFIEARKACNLPVENVTREMVSDLVEKHRIAVMTKYSCKDVELSITIEKGNPRLKLRPKT
jgi:hypothetical protein